MKMSIATQESLRPRIRRAALWGALLAAATATAATPATAGSASASLPSAASPSRTRHFTYSGRAMTIGNAIGSITISESRTSDFTIEVQLGGADALGPKALVITQKGDRLDLSLGDSPAKRYIYPPLKNTKVSLGKTSDQALRRIGFGKRKIEVRGHGDGPTLWADLVIGVPAESRLTIINGVGEIRATNLRATLRARSRSGKIVLTQCSGSDLRLDTGSGDVEIRGVSGGALHVDTGSGDIDARVLRMDRADLDTGSGDINLEDARAAEIKADTGSGDTVLQKIQTRVLKVDTGSGSIQVSATEAERVRLDTGSGSIHLAPATLTSGNWKADVGSGEIEIDLPPKSAAHLVADTASGHVVNRVPSAEVRKRSRGHLELTLGSGTARVVLDSAAGDITIRGG